MWSPAPLAVRWCYSRSQPLLLISGNRSLMLMASRILLLGRSRSEPRTRIPEKAVVPNGNGSDACLATKCSPSAVPLTVLRASSLCSFVLVARLRYVSPTYLSPHFQTRWYTTFRSVHASEPDMQATQAALGRPRLRGLDGSTYLRHGGLRRADVQIIELRRRFL